MLRPLSSSIVRPANGICSYSKILSSMRNGGELSNSKPLSPHIELHHHYQFVNSQTALQHETGRPIRSPPGGWERKGRWCGKLPTAAAAAAAMAVKHSTFVRFLSSSRGENVPSIFNWGRTKIKIGHFSIDDRLRSGG